MKKRWFLIGGILAVLLTLGVVALVSQSEAVPAIQLKWENVIATLTVTGEVRGNVTVDFSPPVTARITRLLVDEGDVIRPGQLLAQLDDAPVRDQLSQSEAQAAQAQAAYANVLQGTRPEQIAFQEARVREASRRISETRASLASAEAQAQQSVSNAQRMQNLYRQEFISAQELENAQTQVSVTTQEVHRLRANLNTQRSLHAQALSQLAQARNGPTQPEIREVAESARAARVAVQEVADQLANYRIVSNINGIVIQRVQDSGDLAAPGQVVLRAVKPETLQVFCSVEENDLAKVRVGAQAYIVFDALPETAIAAQIIRIGSRVNPENGAVEVRAVPSRTAWKKLSGIRYMPGMTADVNIITGRLKNALVLPATAVRNNNGTLSVYVFRNNRLVRQVIVAERLSVENYLIRSGLQAGDWVAATANDTLLGKKRVKPIPQDKVPRQPKPPSGMAAP
jgi:multidrug resistance efflux pump